MLAHELRNPMAPVRNALHLIRNPAISTQQLSWATDVMERQTSHMTRLIDDLLDVSRITSGKVRLQSHQVDVRAIVRDAIESTRPALESRGHQLVVNVPDRTITVWGDPVRLQQVVGNLLTNAYKYTEPGGTITVDVEATTGSEAMVRVRDTGLGISEELLPHIFELFVQGDRTMDRSQGGLGVGLTLVHRLIEAHGGRVDVRSDGLGAGSEFVVRLPLINARDERPSENAQPSPDIAVPRRILVVDDNPDTTDSVKLLLEIHRHEVRIAHDGVAAIEVAKQFSPDVVLLDLGLPQMNGYETVKHLRTIPQTRDAIIIAFSGYGQEEDKRRSMEAGFNEHLVKPAAPEKILQAVQQKSPS
jgi:CheY-like chemotaxis protein